MKKIIGVLLILALGLITTRVFAGVLIGSDIYTTMSLENQQTNEVNPTITTPGWHGENSYLYLGLYPQISDKNIKGDAKIFVNSGTYNNIYFGGAKITAHTADKAFTVKAFAYSPLLALSDPMATGAAYVSGVSTDPMMMPVRFSDGSNTTYYPVTEDKKWYNGYNFALGGNRGMGISTVAQLGGGLMSLEDFFAWNINNFDSMGALLKLNPMDIAGLFNVEVGATADILKYKSAQDFSSYNAYYLSDPSKLLPSQSFYGEDRYQAFGGYFNVGIMKMVNVYAQAKITSKKAKIADTDANNAINGLILYTGAYTKTIPGSVFELNFTMKSDIGNTNTILWNAYENYMNIKAKAYGAYDLEVMGMKLYFLLDGGIVSVNNSFVPFQQYEYVSFGTESFSNVSGVNASGSVKLDFLYMFSLRAALRFASMNFTGNINNYNYNLSTLQSRFFLDVDLEDITKGLWVTIGGRLNTYHITTTSSLVSGDASYFLPYAEVKYVFGADSFARLSWGMGDFNGVLSTAYGIGYDQYKLQNDSLLAAPTSGDLYNKADFDLAHKSMVSLEVGIRL